MAKFEKLNRRLTDFIERQPLFFVATAGVGGRVNVSPKGMDSLIVVDETNITWLSVTGSGNETAAHVIENGRMTLMFCAFEGEAMIVRAYGNADVVYPHDSAWSSEVANFPDLPGSRQIYRLTIDLVQTSCGSGVPVMAFQKSRGEKELLPFYDDMGPDGVEKFWRKKNAVSIDGKSTGLKPDG